MGTSGQILKLTSGTSGNVGVLSFEDDSSGGSGSDITVQEEGSDLSTAATKLNFVGSGVTATNDGSDASVKVITIDNTLSRPDSEKTSLIAGDQFLIFDDDDSFSPKYISTESLSTLLAGSGLTVASSVLSIDSSAGATFASLTVAEGAITCGSISISKSTPEFSMTDGASYSSLGGAVIKLGAKDSTNAMSDTNRMGALEFHGATSSGSILSGASIEAFCAADWSGTERATDLVFKTTTGTTSGEHLRITAAGNVGIGQNSPGERLEVAGRIKISETSSPSAPSDNDGGILYAKSDGKLYWRSHEVSTEADLTAGASSTFSDTIIANSGVTSKGTLTVGAGGDEFTISESSDNITMAVAQSNKSLTITGNDGGSTINALFFDMENAGNATFNGSVTANAGVVIDNITIDGSEIDLSSGDLTVDVAGDIILDAAGEEVIFKDGSTNVGHVSMDSDNLTIKSLVSDKDIIFQGNDGGSGITALTLDMSAAGAATFNGAVTSKGTLTVGAGGDEFTISESSGNITMAVAQSNKSLTITGNDGGSTINALVFDMENTGNATFNGSVTANAGVVIDNITIDGSEIDLSSGDLTVDVAGDIILDAAGEEVIFKDGSTNVGHVSMDSDNLTIKSLVSDKDIIFQGNDGGSGITALTLDMSAAGAATFNGSVTAAGVVIDNITIDGSEIDLSSGDLTVDVAGDIILDAAGEEVIFKDGSTNVGHVSMDSDNLTIKSLVSDKDIIFQGNDGGSGITALTLDMSAAGAATFNGSVTANAGVVIDNITIDGSEIDLSSGDLTVDVAGNIILDAAGGDFKYNVDGTEILRISNSSSNVVVKPIVDEKNIIFQQKDGNEVARIDDDGKFYVGGTEGVIISQGAIQIKNGGTQSYIDFYCESSNAHYTRLQAPAHSAFSGNVTITLPAASGTVCVAGGTGLTLSSAGSMSVDASQTQITAVGTIATGVWNGTAIASDYLDSDTAHLSVAQTFSALKTFTAGVNITGNLDFSDDNNDIIIKDNSSTALVIKEDTNVYMTFDSTNSTEKIISNKTFQAARGIDVKNSSTSGGYITLYESSSNSGNNFTKIKAADNITTSATYILPADIGSEDQILKISSVSGTEASLAWADETGGGGGGGGGSSLTIQEEGSSLSTAATTLNFVGTGVTASGTGATKTITVTTGTQNVFSTIAVSGQDNVEADSTTDTLTLVAGSNMTITTDASSDTITFASSGGGGGISFDGSTANGLLTYKDADEASVESNLTFDGSILDITGYIKQSKGFTTLTSTTSAYTNSGVKYLVCSFSVPSGGLLTELTWLVTKPVYIVKDSQWGTLSSVTGSLTLAGGTALLGDQLNLTNSYGTSATSINSYGNLVSALSGGNNYWSRSTFTTGSSGSFIFSKITNPSTSVYNSSASNDTYYFTIAGAYNDSSQNYTGDISGSLISKTYSNIAFTASGDSWDTNSDHTLSVGDLIVFTVAGSGTSGYSVDTNYFVQANSGTSTGSIGGTWYYNASYYDFNTDSATGLSVNDTITFDTVGNAKDQGDNLLYNTSTTYYVIDSGSYIKLSLSEGGSEILGTGTPHQASSSGSYTVSGNVTDNSIFKLSTSIGGSVVDGTGDSTGWTAKAYSIIGANWSFDYTGGTAEDLWTTSAAHGLSVGDKIQFVRSGGGATGYSIDTDYYVVAVPSSTTVQLSTSTGGSVLEGSSDSSGFWYAVDVSDKNEFKMALTYLLM